MKKIVYLLISLAAAAALAAGCSDEESSFEAKSYSGTLEEISSISLDVRDREIEVTPSSDNKIYIDYYQNDKEYFDILVSEGGVLNMTSVFEKEWTDYIGNKTPVQNRKISLHIPDAVLTSLKLSTTNEDITLCPVETSGNILLSSNGGDIVFDKIVSESQIDIKAKNGDISGTIVGGYDDYAIKSEIKKGETNLPKLKEDGKKALNVSNNNGNIEINFVRE